LSGMRLRSLVAVGASAAHLATAAVAGQAGGGALRGYQ
jgi:hypothetical protein